MSWNIGGVPGRPVPAEPAPDERAALPRTGTRNGGCRSAGAARRAAAAGVVGAAVVASGLVGAGRAEAVDPVVVDTCTEKAPSTAYGQRIMAGPEALDAKVEQAALLVFPLQFALADKARQQFLRTSPVPLGTVTEKDRNFSGTELADALAENIASVPAFGDKGDAVNWHVHNLAALGCLSGADVPGQRKPEPKPEPPATSEPSPAPEPPSDTGKSRPTGSGADRSGTERSGDRQSGPARSGSAGTSDAVTGRTAPAPPGTPSAPAPAKRVVPPDYSYVPGSLPPWSNTRFGRPPGQQPRVGDLLGGQRAGTDAQRERVRTAGSARALPTGAGNRIALPVLIAAITLAGVTSALVRTWVLRRA